MIQDQKSKPLPPSLDDHLCLGVYTAGMTIQRLYKPLLDELGITYPQYLVLNLLWLQSPQTVGGIAEQLDLESSTLTPLLKRLESSGLVQRNRNPNNERQVLIALTDDGLALRNDAGCVSQALLENSGMTLDEINTLNKTLRGLNRNIKRLKGQTKNSEG